MHAYIYIYYIYTYIHTYHETCCLIEFLKILGIYIYTYYINPAYWSLPTWVWLKVVWFKVIYLEVWWSSTSTWPIFWCKPHFGSPVLKWIMQLLTSKCVKFLKHSGIILSDWFTNFTAEFHSSQRNRWRRDRLEDLNQTCGAGLYGDMNGPAQLY